MTTASVQGHQVPNSWVKAVGKLEAVQIKQSYNIRLPWHPHQQEEAS